MCSLKAFSRYLSVVFSDIYISSQLIFAYSRGDSWYISSLPVLFYMQIPISVKLNLTKWMQTLMQNVCYSILNDTEFAVTTNIKSSLLWTYCGTKKLKKKKKSKLQHFPKEKDKIPNFNFYNSSKWQIPNNRRKKKNNIQWHWFYLFSHKWMKIGFLSFLL